MQLHSSRRTAPSVLLSMTSPNKELFYRQRALLRRWAMTPVTASGKAWRTPNSAAASSSTLKDAAAMPACR